MAKKHIYYIVYFYQANNGNSFGKGAAQITRDNPIKYNEDILKVAETIQEKFNYEVVIIESWRKIKAHPAKRRARNER